MWQFRGMREVFVHQDTARVGHYKSILDANDIQSFIRNGLSNNSIAEMPAGIFFPTLCVVNDEDYERAIEILRHIYQPEPTDAIDWNCAGCGEEVPGTFEHCWQCGAAATEKVPLASAAEGNGQTEGLSDLEKTVTPESLRKIASIFRWLVLANVALGLLGFWLFPNFELHPPEALKEWMAEQDRAPVWLAKIAFLAWSVRRALWGFSLLLCFLLWNPGRLLLLVVLLCDLLVGFGLPSGVYPRWVNALYYFQPLITGALLALAYLGPLQVRFASTRRRD